MKKTFLLSSILSFLVLSIFSQIPATYYNAATGKTNAELKTALHQIIEVGNRLDYGSGSGSTWSGFAKSDLHPEGYAWDMYSLQKRSFSSTSTSAPSGMNIEHSVAKSWWGGTNNDAYKDLYHLNPSDSEANSARSNYPLGTTTGGTFNNGSIKVGNNTFSSDYTGPCFEPLDEYKGDFARAYLYMFTCYEDFTWTGTSAPAMIIANEKWPMLKTWAINLLLTWHRQDPVSEKERNRLAAIYKLQNNRNPYIDYPELVEHLWGNRKGQPWTAEGGDYPYLNTPSTGAIFDFGKVVYPHAAILTVNLKAQNLTGDLSISITGANAANFLVTNSTISKADAEAGYLIPVNYSAQTMGAKTAQLNISGGGITATSVTLKAFSTDEFLALPATNITSNGFTANWAASATATGYNLNVYSLKSNGATESTTLLQEEFLSGLPVSWTSEGYTDNQTSGSMRLASGSNPGKIIFPALNLSTSGTVLTVKARQYVNDAGAQLTATLNNQPLAVWSTGVGNQNFTVTIPQSTSSSVIALSAVTGSRVYVDYVNVATQGTVQTPVSISSFPKSVGNVLTYTVNGLVNDSAYYYTITPVENSASVSNAISVRTSLLNNLEENEFQHIRYSVSSEGIRISNLKINSKLNLFDCTGRKIKTYISNSTEMVLQVVQKGLYLLQIEQDNRFKTYKIQY